MTQWETDPIVVGGVMYISTNTDQVLALDAATGRERWRYTPDVSLVPLMLSGNVPVSRGVEVAGGHVYLLTFDARLIALDADTGREVWRTVVADPSLGYTEPSPPTYWNGMLFVGSAEGDTGLRGFVAAYDARTGRQRWRFYTVPARGTGWMPAAGEHGGGDVWMPPAIDASTGVLVVGTGNPSPDLSNSMRPGCNLWVDATVALNARTGRFLWGHTQVCPDLWDYDSGQTPLFLSLNIRGKPVRAVGEGNKSGYYWVFDERTGETLSRTPALARQSTPRQAPTRAGVFVCPGKFGGLLFSPPAYDHRSSEIFVPGLNLCMVYKLSATAALHGHGLDDFGGTAEPTHSAPTGFLAAVDARTGAIRWRTAMPKPVIGGVLATAGAVVFSGCDDGYFYAFDAANGHILWRYKAGLGFGAAPITYAVKGTQYLAIAAGGSSVASYSHVKTGGRLLVFKLPSQVGRLR